MKNRIFILPLCVLTASVMTANDGLYFPEGSKWTNASSGASYNIQGDTLVDGKMYHKVISINKDGQKLVALKKEEGKKIYVRCEGTDTDVLLYNFGLEVGDSITQHTDDFGFSWCQGPCTYYVERIDTVTLLDGRKAKCIFYDGRMWDIEFVGSETGFFGPITMPEIPTISSGDLEDYSYCFSINGKPIYETYPEICKNCGFFNLPFAQATTWYGIRYFDDYLQEKHTPFITNLTYSLGSDTVINDKQYRQIYYTHEYEHIINAYRGAMRQSEDRLQVYYIPWGSNNEYLLYDFDVNQGDTVYAYAGFNDISCEEMAGFPITQPWIVGSAQTIDNRKHIVVLNDYYGTSLEWIEGIGTHYILWPVGRTCYATGMEVQFQHTLCAADSEGNILYSYDTDYLGFHNDCPNWHPMTIENTTIITPSAVKVLRNGQLFIERGDKTYTLTGQEVK